MTTQEQAEQIVRLWQSTRIGLSHLKTDERVALEELIAPAISEAKRDLAEKMIAAAENAHAQYKNQSSMREAIINGLESVCEREGIKLTKGER